MSLREASKVVTASSDFLKCKVLPHHLAIFEKSHSCGKYIYERLPPEVSVDSDSRNDTAPFRD